MKQGLIIIFGLLWVACEGQATTALGDMPDLGSSPDISTTEPDVTVEPDMPPMVDPLCVGVTCLPNSVCGRGSCWCAPGFMGDPNVGCTPGNPCEGSDCAFGATCRDDGECVCDIGFEENLGFCELVDVTPVEERTEADVCARWAADYPEVAGVQWNVEPQEQCDVGELDPTYQLDAVRRVALYRWLVGLPGVTTTTEYAKEAQACATALDAQNVGATNSVTSDFTCYSADAATGAMNSSIQRTAASAAAAVDLLMNDTTASMGNRRWILNPEMGATAFGIRGDYTCMYAIDTNGDANPQYVAYPSGFFPAAAIHGRWMWASGQLFADETTTVAVTDSGGAAVDVTNVTAHPGNIFPGALSWEVGVLAPGEYTVTIQGLTGLVNELVYPVNIVTCP